jgi:ribonuclease-3
MSDKKPLTGLFFTAEIRAGSLRPALLADLTARLGHLFSDSALLAEALTHSTYAYEHRQNNLADNERLEFLGDAVLDLVISQALYKRHDRLSEGQMTKARALVVRETTLAQIAQSLQLGDCLLLGRGEEASGGRDKPSNLANALEALFGAVFMDGGYERVAAVILSLLSDSLELALSGHLVYDYKSRLLELVQATRGGSVLRFQILEETGPVHERTFVAGVLVDEQLVATGSGCSKKDAEQLAARSALERLSCDQQGCDILPSDTAGG